MEGQERDLQAVKAGCQGAQGTWIAGHTVGDTCPAHAGQCWAFGEPHMDPMLPSPVPRRILVSLEISSVYILVPSPRLTPPKPLMHLGVFL